MLEVDKTTTTTPIRANDPRDPKAAASKCQKFYVHRSEALTCMCVCVCVCVPREKEQQVFKCYARVVHFITFAHIFSPPRPNIVCFHSLLLVLHLSDETQPVDHRLCPARTEIPSAFQLASLLERIAFNRSLEREFHSLLLHD